ncbi:membrane-associated protein, putative, partial [Bodo saltans]
MYAPMFDLILSFPLFEAVTAHDASHEMVVYSPCPTTPMKGACALVSVVMCVLMALMFPVLQQSLTRRARYLFSAGNTPALDNASSSAALPNEERDDSFSTTTILNRRSRSFEGDLSQCSNIPRHLSCIVPMQESSRRAVSPPTCKIRYFAATELACGSSAVVDTDNLTRIEEDRGQLPGGRICPCLQKRVVIVRNMIIVAVLYAGVLDQMYVFTPLLPRPSQHGRMLRKAPATHDSLAALRERDGNWALVAASVMRWTVNFCRRDPFENERRNLRDSLDAYLLPTGRTPKVLAAGRTPGELSRQLMRSSVPLSTQQPPWTCKALAQQSGDKWVPPVASGNGTARLSAAVYYGLEGFADIAGHAMEALFNAIGQYITDGLNETGVPWLVPCSDEWVGSVRPLVWV